MSSPSSSSHPHSLSNSDANAKVRVVTSRRQPKSNDDYKSANVAVSSRIYWKVADRGATSKLKSLYGFWCDASLELSRLQEGTWDDVKAAVKEDKYEGKLRITVQGRLHGRDLRNKIFPGSESKIEIIPNAPEQHEVWVERIRARIAPWDVLRQKMKAGWGVEELEIALGGSANRLDGAEPPSAPTGKVENKWRDKFIKLPEELQKLSIVDKLTAQGGAAAVGLGGTLENLVAGAEQVTETAKFLGDLSKCIGGLSTIFQLVSLGAHGVSMCLEASRGQQVLPDALVQITILLRYVLESLTEIMIPSREVKENAVDFVFDALKEVVCIMDTAETQILRGRFSRIVHADDVKKVEEKIKELKQKAVIADNTSRAAGNASRIAEIALWIRAVDEKVNRLEEEREIGGDLPHHVRPSVSAFFSGRKQELKTLIDKLEERGSAAITQFGGAGKTELMIAFADRAERDGQVPGGVFWVTVDGDVRDVIGSLAGLAEKLTRRKMNEDERRNGNVVIARLEQGLNEKEGRWLLCLDNADDDKVGGILNEVCRLADPSRSSGWVVVTSRQGRPRVWAEMERDQKIILEPFCVEDAMVALWRQSRVIKTGKADDDQVMKEIKELEGVDQAEYCALKKLCGDDNGQGLGGLPLALVQAGSFIAQFECSFAEYLDMFESANRNEDWEYVMNKTEDMKPIQDSQRSILTTWKISVEKLSVTARTVLQGMAMLGEGGIEEAMVKGILEAITANGGGIVAGMFQNVIMKELMHGSSLIRRDEGGERGKRKYGMHRLVRGFVLNDMGRGSAEWNDVYSLALPVVSESIQAELEKEGRSFYDFPDVLETIHRELAMHSVALVHHFVIEAQGSEGCDLSEVKKIHWYSGKVMGFMGRLKEAALVWEQLLAILRQQDAKIEQKVHGNKPHPHIASVLNNLGNVYDEMGELNKALETHEESLQMKRAVYGNKPHPEIASSLNNIGNMYSRMGKLDKALEKQEESLQMFRAVCGNKPHPFIASFLGNIGNVYSRMGQPEKALKKHEHSLKMYRAVHGNKPHPDIVSSLGNLGLAYLITGELDKALEKQEESLQMSRALHGNKPHPVIASSLNNLGNVYGEMGELEKALEKHEESLDMKRAVYGNKPHPDIASSLNNLGNMYVRMGELDKALEKYEQTLEMYRAVHGNLPHFDIASSLNNLGHVYEGMGLLEKALEKHEEGLEMYRAVYGNKPHPHIASSLNNLGHVYEGMGELEKALEKHEQSLEILRAVHGNKPHPHIASSLNNLGNVYRRMGKVDKAVEKHGESLEMKRAVYGNKPHPDIASSLNNLGNVYEGMGELDKALEKHEESLEMYRAVHGNKPHPDIASSLNNLGNVYLRMCELDNALEKYEQTLEMYRAVHGNKPHPDIASSLNNLGNVYEGMGELNKALEKLEESLEMKRVVYRNKPHPHIASSLNNLGNVYSKMGKLDEALEKYEESLEMKRAVHGQNNPHPDTAISLLNIGIIHCRNENMSRAAEFLEHSLKMLRTVHGLNSQHPNITRVLSILAGVYGAQGRQDEVAAIRERNREIGETGDGEVL